MFSVHLLKPFQAGVSDLMGHQKLWPLTSMLNDLNIKKPKTSGCRETTVLEPVRARHVCGNSPTLYLQWHWFKTPAGFPYSFQVVVMLPGQSLMFSCGSVDFVCDFCREFLSSSDGCQTQLILWK